MTDGGEELPGVGNAAALAHSKKLEGELEGVMAEVAEIHEEVRGVKRHVGQIDAFLNAAPTGGPWAWETLGDLQTAYLWRDLDRFVQWLHATYLRHLPRLALAPCWYKHPHIVAQLTALMVAHQATYNETALEVSFRLVEWHERALFPTLNQILASGVSSTCASGHTEPARPDLVREPELIERTDIEAVAAALVAAATPTDDVTDDVTADDVTASDNDDNDVDDNDVDDERDWRGAEVTP
jgi:hypothetical protein